MRLAGASLQHFDGSVLNSGCFDKIPHEATGCWAPAVLLPGSLHLEARAGEAHSRLNRICLEIIILMGEPRIHSRHFGPRLWNVELHTEDGDNTKTCNVDVQWRYFPAGDKLWYWNNLSVTSTHTHTRTCTHTQSKVRVLKAISSMSHWLTIKKQWPAQRENSLINEMSK